MRARCAGQLVFSSGYNNEVGGLTGLMRTFFPEFDRHGRCSFIYHMVKSSGESRYLFPRRRIVDGWNLKNTLRRMPRTGMFPVYP